MSGRNRSARPRPTDLRYLHADSAGLSRAYNEGVAAARHDELVFTHVVAEGRVVVRCLRRWKEPCGALGELVYAAGLLAGCAGWWIGPGRRG